MDASAYAGTGKLLGRERQTETKKERMIKK